MEPNNNMQNNVSGAGAPRPMRAPGHAVGAARGTAPANAPMAPSVPAGGDIVFSDKPKKSHAMLIGMIILALLAAGGIGFGVWAFLDGNSRVAKKDEEIADLNNQISSLEQEKSDLTDQVAKLQESNEEAQSQIADDEAKIQEDEQKIQEDEAQIAEDQQNEAKGYQVTSIGECVFDAGGISILKCDATTSIGNGKFVWDSQSGKLRFVTLQ